MLGEKQKYINDLGEWNVGIAFGGWSKFLQYPHIQTLPYTKGAPCWNI